MPLPRTLTLIALLWAVASLVATVGTRVPIQPTTLSYTPGVRAMIVMLACGACAIYPIGRVMFARGLWPPALVALDAVALTGMFTVIFWPVQLVTYWPRPTAIVVWVMVLGWVVVATGCVAVALRSQSDWVRAAWSLACPGVLGAGVLLDALHVAYPLPALLGPAVATLELTPRAGASLPPGALAIAAAPWVAAAVLWACACIRHTRAFAPAVLAR